MKTTIIAEWIPHREDYRLYDKLYPQWTIAYADDLDEVKRDHPEYDFIVVDTPNDDTPCAWLIGVSSTNVDGVATHCVIGTKEEVRQYLWKLCLEEREATDPDIFEYGTSSSSEMSFNSKLIKGELYCYNCFADYHTDYSATKMPAPIEL